MIVRAGKGKRVAVPHAASDAMTRYASGQESAFAELYDLLAPRIYAYLLRRTRDAGLADDLFQQTLLHVHRARASFMPGAPVLPWVLTIARRVVIDQARSAAREAARARAAEASREAEDVLPADEVVGAWQAASQMEAEIARLPALQRDAFELVKRRGLSLTEAARSLSITTTALKVRVHRACRTLFAALEARR